VTVSTNGTVSNTRHTPYFQGGPPHHHHATGGVSTQQFVLLCTGHTPHILTNLAHFSKT